MKFHVCFVPSIKVINCQIIFHPSLPSLIISNSPLIHYHLHIALVTPDSRTLKPIITPQQGAEKLLIKSESMKTTEKSVNLSLDSFLLCISFIDYLNESSTLFSLNQYLSRTQSSIHIDNI